MVREDKVQAVKDLEDLFKSANALVLAEYRGLTVSQQTKLRRSLKNAGASFNVVKMSLAKRAAENIGLDSLSDYFAGPTGVTIIDSDPVEAAKVLKDFSKENDAFVVKGGLMNSEPLTVEQINVLANIEPRDVLLAKIAGGFNAPLVKVAAGTKAIINKAISEEEINSRCRKILMAKKWFGLAEKAHLNSNNLIQDLNIKTYEALNRKLVEKSMTVLQNSNLDLDLFYKKNDIPKITVGDKVKVTIYLELPKNLGENEKKGKERIQAFEGVVISKHLASNKIDSTITVRKMFQGGGTEKVFVLNSPWVKSIEILGNSIIRRSKLYYLRERTGKSARLKRRL